MESGSPSKKGIGAPLHIVSPLLESPTLSEVCGRQVFLKMDNTQPAGSFKIRGIGHHIKKKVSLSLHAGISVIVDWNIASKCFNWRPWAATLAYLLFILYYMWLILYSMKMKDTSRWCHHQEVMLAWLLPVLPRLSVWRPPLSFRNPHQSSWFLNCSNRKLKS